MTTSIAVVLLAFSGVLLIYTCLYWRKDLLAGGWWLLTIALSVWDIAVRRWRGDSDTRGEDAP